MCPNKQFGVSEPMESEDPLVDSSFVGKFTKIVHILLNFFSVDEILGFLLILDEMNHPNGDQGNHVDLMDKIIEPELLDKIKESSRGIGYLC